MFYWQAEGAKVHMMLFGNGNSQFHLIACVDDSTQLVLKHIRVHDSFPSALKTRLNWSKNMDNKQDAPRQIKMGLLNPMYCVLCSFAFWSESDDIRVPDGRFKSKAMIKLH